MKTFISDPIMYPTYEQGIKVVIGNTLRECCLENNLPWSETDDDELDSYVQQVGGYIYIVLRSDNIIRLVLHECIHAINVMYSNMGATMDVSNDEIYVRDVSHLQDIVLSIFKEHAPSIKISESD